MSKPSIRSTAADSVPSKPAKKAQVAGCSASGPKTKEALIRALQKILVSKGPLRSQRASFAELLREARLELLGLTQSDMDKVLGLSSGQIAVWERGRDTPRVVTQEGVIYRINLLVKFMQSMKAVPEIPKGRGGPRHKRYKKRDAVPVPTGANRKGSAES